MAAFRIKSEGRIQAHRFLVGIPLVAVTIFCFAYLMTRPQHLHPANASSNEPVRSFNRPLSHNLPALQFTNLPKITVISAPAANNSSAVTPTASPQGSASNGAASALQSAPPTQASSSSNLLNLPVRLPTINLNKVL